jgi:two-component system chemotaxis response regulator CheY
MSDEAFDPSGLTALVVDHNHFHRGIALDQLRGMGFARAAGASNGAEGWESLCKHNPNIVLVEWLDSQGDGLDFVRRVRMSEEVPNRAVAMFMLTGRGGRADVETARKAGVDGYMRKPISALALKERVRAVVLNPQPFIVTASYVGPCRRRKQDPAFDGPWRRLDDKVTEAAMGEEEQSDVKAALARARVAALEECARDLTHGDARAARKVFRAAQDLCDVAVQIGDTTLTFGAKEMVRYLQAQGATERLDPEVVRTHIAALHQLVHLPHALRDERERVAQSLKRMVDKKLRAAG